MMMMMMRHTETIVCAEKAGGAWEILDNETLAVTIARCTGRNAEGNAKRIEAPWNAAESGPLLELTPELRKLGLWITAGQPLDASRLNPDEWAAVGAAIARAQSAPQPADVRADQPLSES